MDKIYLLTYQFLSPGQGYYMTRTILTMNWAWEVRKGNSDIVVLFVKELTEDEYEFLKYKLVDKTGKND